ncbi:MAG: glycoside hydrolase family 3 C-terminal domain-containing protein [Fibrobacterales bacterium]
MNYLPIIRAVLIVTLFAGFAAKSIFAQTLDDTIDEYISGMNIQDKLWQIANNGYMSTGDHDIQGVPGMLFNDGPHGVRAAALGWIPDATSFPLPIGMAAMWDRPMWYDLGVAIAEEFQGYNIDVMLGPSMDLSHNPQNGRTGETAGEDPYLTSQFAINVVQGVQSLPVVATIKHYLGVNKQNDRHGSDITMTEQQLMDHHGYHYRRAIQEGGAMAVMSSYNLVNGVHTSENELTLKEILKKRWGYPFLVMTDWWSVYNGANTINAGNDLCMGSEDFGEELMMPNIESGAVKEETVDKAVARVLKVKMLTGLLDDGYPDPDESKINTREHQELARRADEKGMVLLKNNDGILPFPRDKKIAIIGPSSDVARTNIGGSSNLTTPYNVGPKEGIEALIGSENITHVLGCALDGDDRSGFDEAKEVAKNADYVLFFGGLNDQIEGEMGHEGDSPGDRTTNDFQTPTIQRELIKELAAVNPNIVVVLQSGGVLGVTDYIDTIKGLLYSFYTSQEGGNAFANVLFGEVNPAGRMPVTMAVDEDDMPEWNEDFTDDFNDGYRWFDEKGTDIQYAFGFGLSYTTFEYSNLTLNPAHPQAGDRVTVMFDVKNSGSVDGEDVPQLYFSNHGSAVWHPKKELKNFQRVAIAAGQTKNITMIIDSEDLFYYDLAKGQYSVEPGRYTVKVGPSSDSLPLVAELDYTAGEEKSDLRPITLYTYPRYPNDGEEVLFVATIKNYGTEKTNAGNIVVKWSVDGEDIAFSAPLSESLLPGQMTMVSSDPSLASSAKWSYNSGATITVMVDANEVESELYEQNNSRDYTIPHTGAFKKAALYHEKIIRDAPSSSSEGELLSSSLMSSSSGDLPLESSDVEESSAQEGERNDDESSEVESSTTPIIGASQGREYVDLRANTLTVSLSTDLAVYAVLLYSVHGDKVAEYQMNADGFLKRNVSHLVDGPYVVSIREAAKEQTFLVLKVSQ